MPGTSKVTEAPGARSSASGCESSTTGSGPAGLAPVAVTVTTVRATWISAGLGVDGALPVTAGIASRPVFVIRTVTPVPSLPGSTATLTARSPQTRTSDRGIAMRSARGRGLPRRSSITTRSRYRPGSRGAATARVIACALVLVRRAFTVRVLAAVALAVASMIAASRRTGTQTARNTMPAGMVPPVHRSSMVARSPPFSPPRTTGAANRMDRPRSVARRSELAIWLTRWPQLPDEDQQRCIARNVGCPPHQRPPGVRYASLMNLATASMPAT